MNSDLRAAAAAPASSQPKSVPAQPRTEVAPDRLSQTKFTDLYITGSMSQKPLFRNLRWHGMPKASNGMSAPPDSMTVDLRMLFSAITRQYKDTKKTDFHLNYDGIGYRCSIISIPGISSTDRPEAAEVTWCIRQINSNLISFDKIGMDDDIAVELSLMGIMRGVVLISGAFGSGKTTTASAVIDHWVEKTNEVAITIEDPPEIDLARMDPRRGTIIQLDVTGKSYTDAIRSSRRWAPRFIYLGEIRTPEAAAELLHIGISGPLVICTVHADSPINAIRSVAQFAHEKIGDNNAREMLSASLLGSYHQEFVKTGLQTKFLNLSGASAAPSRTRIRVGDFTSLAEDLNYQTINRKKASAGSRNLTS